MANETAFVATIKRYLKERGAYCEKIWGGGFQSAGIPDIIGCYRGYFIGIEAKVGNNKPSEIQKAKIKMINNAGGFARVVWNLDEVKELLDNIDNYIKEVYKNE